jgi:hypothetical protein
VAQESIRPDQIPPGPILQYYGDIASGAIKPEDVKIEALTYFATIGPTGLVVSSSDKITVNSRMNFAIREIRATVMNAELAGAAPDLITFQVKEQGRNFEVFKKPIDFAAAANPKVPYRWDGVYICVPGTDLACEWTVDSALWAIFVGVSKRVKITISGDYIACGPTQR